ncbi:hypothetical protein M501DRAFT_602485 [Patellaria atrata CBS 101060]|uniref:Uncharacterized protein n=1 Tax=Patellaria atrata CBS 101060 TaxID=1346257 RepID=A0A9P4S274_9PEZI|nr:hypothetical protein M501DRAFT_602485 [Patellaria atrata CBS 101060]
MSDMLYTPLLLNGIASSSVCFYSPHTVNLFLCFYYHLLEDSTASTTRQSAVRNRSFDSQADLNGMKTGGKHFSFYTMLARFLFFFFWGGGGGCFLLRLVEGQRLDSIYCIMERWLAFLAIFLLSLLSSAMKYVWDACLQASPIYKQRELLRGGKLGDEVVLCLYSVEQ